MAKTSKHMGKYSGRAAPGKPMLPDPYIMVKAPLLYTDYHKLKSLAKDRGLSFEHLLMYMVHKCIADGVYAEGVSLDIPDTIGTVLPGHILDCERALLRFLDRCGEAGASLDLLLLAWRETGIESEDDFKAALRELMTKNKIKLYNVAGQAVPFARLEDSQLSRLKKRKKYKSFGGFER